jgi:hypothetical protein
MSLIEDSGYDRVVLIGSEVLVTLLGQRLSAGLATEQIRQPLVELDVKTEPRVVAVWGKSQPRDWLELSGFSRRTSPMSWMGFIGIELELQITVLRFRKTIGDKWSKADLNRSVLKIYVELPVALTRYTGRIKVNDLDTDTLVSDGYHAAIYLGSASKLATDPSGGVKQDKATLDYWLQDQIRATSAISVAYQDLSLFFALFRASAQDKASRAGFDASLKSEWLGFIERAKQALLKEVHELRDPRIFNDYGGPMFILMPDARTSPQIGGKLLSDNRTFRWVYGWGVAQKSIRSGKLDLSQLEDFDFSPTIGRDRAGQISILVSNRSLISELIGPEVEHKLGLAGVLTYDAAKGESKFSGKRKVTFDGHKAEIHNVSVGLVQVRSPAFPTRCHVRIDGWVETLGDIQQNFRVVLQLGFVASVVHSGSRAALRLSAALAEKPRVADEKGIDFGPGATPSFIFGPLLTLISGLVLGTIAQGKFFDTLGESLNALGIDRDEYIERVTPVFAEASVVAGDARESVPADGLLVTDKARSTADLFIKIGVRNLPQNVFVRYVVADGPDPDGRLDGVGGRWRDFLDDSDVKALVDWTLPIDEVIARIEGGQRFFALPEGKAVAQIFVAAGRNGTKYLRTAADDDTGNNLGNLPKVIPLIKDAIGRTPS